MPSRSCRCRCQIGGRARGRRPTALPTYNDSVKLTGRPFVAALAAAGALVALLRRRRSRRPIGLGGPGPPPAGVREPRRPVQPAGSGAAAVDPTEG
jgi:hypothetical protein